MFRRVAVSLTVNIIASGKEGQVPVHRILVEQEELSLGVLDVCP